MRHTHGFTLVELTVSLGLLTGFILFLVQLLSTGVSVFEEGERGQELADRTAAASSAVEDVVLSMIGPPLRVEQGPPVARLLVQYAPLDFRPEPGVQHLQVIRATVRLSEIDEERLLRDQLLPEAQRTARTSTKEDVAVRLDELVAQAPRAKRGDMLLVVSKDDDFLVLRRGLFLPGQRIPIRPDLDIGLWEPEDVGGEDFPPAAVRAATHPIAVGLLDIEFRFWSQYTRSFETIAGEPGPELVWDSARAGLLPPESEDPRKRFTLDLASQSLNDPTDDVFPRAVQVRMTVGRDLPDAVLQSAIDARTNEVRMSRAEELPDLNWFKIGSEWMQGGDVRGTSVTGVRRGQRGTKPSEHKTLAPVRVGKPVLMVIPLVHGRDSWNG